MKLIELWMQALHHLRKSDCSDNHETALVEDGCFKERYCLWTNEIHVIA